MAHFNTVIAEHPDWELAGIYADEGISGTQVKNRVQFQQMIEDAKAKKIDLILTKSISRFARNVVDCLTNIRLLRSLRPPVSVYFDKERLDSLDEKAEVFLTMLASFAQEESRSISTNIKWATRSRMKAGTQKVSTTSLLGSTSTTSRSSSWNIETPQEAVMQNKNKPLLLRPSGKDYLWGGSRLNDEFEKNIDLTPLAETWECSTHPDGPSYVVGGAFDGQELAEVLRAHPEYLGERHKGENTMPILIKFIDAKKDLSVQVHPTDAYAQEHENGQLGKTEMWYVLDAGRDAKLVYGLKQNCTKAEMRRAIADGTVMKYLQKVPIHKDDLFFIQAGTVHAIGAGALVAEIQENSNLTYRLYDYDRVGKDGKKRELHIDKALDVANLKSSAEPKQPLRVLKYRQGIASELLTRCKYFEVYRMIVNTERRQKVHYRADEIAFRVLLCVNGCGTISYEGGNLPFYKGDCIFVPADSEVLTIHGQAQFLDVRG